MDKNYFVISGDDTGNININDVLTFTADQPGIRELVLDTIAAPAGFSDCLKLSGIRRLKVTIQVVDGHQSIEDAIDINHCQDVELVIDTLYAGKTYASTIKGGSKNIRIQIRALASHGHTTDFDLGNFADQNNDKTTGVSLDVATVDKSPVKVRILTADKPAILNPAQKYDISGGGAISRLFYPLYNILKDLLKIVGIKI